MYTSLPHDDHLDITPLQRALGSTATSYKYYWLWAIIELTLERRHAETGIVAESPVAYGGHHAIGLELKTDDILQRMLLLAWTPIVRYRLSLGSQDQLGSIVMRIFNDSDQQVRFYRTAEVQQLIADWFRRSQRSEYQDFLRYVPYRFLTPYFAEQLKGLTDSHKNRRIAELSSNDSGSGTAPYSLLNIQSGIPGSIRIAPAFEHYLRRSPQVIIGWVKYHLLEYLQRRNSSIPALVHKLEPAQNRDLTAERSHWIAYLTQVHPDGIPDLYSNATVTHAAFDLDHYIPWSFVQHNEFWNLIPSLSTENRSKSDCLPDWDATFAPFADQQYQFYRWCRQHNRSKPLEAYTLLTRGDDAITANGFTSRLQEHARPLYEIAREYGY
ncbi:HNH endonuclease domain-containing protein [Spirochaeta africana]|nr:HNH endonuclease domain-containing protein [Spirochaeta africana]